MVDMENSVYTEQGLTEAFNIQILPGIIETVDTQGEYFEDIVLGEFFDFKWELCIQGAISEVQHEKYDYLGWP